MNVKINHTLEPFNAHPVVAMVLTATSAFIAEYQPLLQFAFFLVTGLIGAFTLVNKIFDTYTRLKNWLENRKKP